MEKTLRLDRPSSAGEPLRPADAIEIALRMAIDQKALDVRALDLAGISDIADYFLIASGTSQRHVDGIADRIRAALAERGEKPIGTDGSRSREWILLDYGSLVVHVFYEPLRQYYRIDDLWSKARVLPIPADLGKQARMLRTGLIRQC